MLVIHNSIGMQRTLDTAVLDPPLRRALVKHIDHLAEQGFAFEELMFFVVVEPGDAAASITGALGFDPAVSRDDDARFGEPGFRPAWECLEHEAGWTELTFVLSDDGSGCVLLVPDLPGVDATLSALCRAYA